MKNGVFGKGFWGPGIPTQIKSATDNTVAFDGTAS
jgi:hypothetical protein